MTKTILTRILNQTEPSLPRRNKQEFREFKKHSSKNHLPPLPSRTRHSPIQALGIPLKPGVRTRHLPIPTRTLLPRTSVQCPSLLPQSPTGMDTLQIRPGGLLCLLFGKNQNELSSKCSVWANRPESQGQSNMIQKTVEPIVIEKGQGLGTPLPSVGKVKTKKDGS